MAGVAEAMAASSLLLETGSVASTASGTHMDRSRKSSKTVQVSRTCMCELGSACPRMSMAFALVKDPRGDFVVLPSSESQLRAAFYRYLRPNDDSLQVKRFAGRRYHVSDDEASFSDETDEGSLESVTVSVIEGYQKDRPSSDDDSYSGSESGGSDGSRSRGDDEEWSRSDGEEDDRSSNGSERGSDSGEDSRRSSDRSGDSDDDRSFDSRDGGYSSRNRGKDFHNRGGEFREDFKDDQRTNKTVAGEGLNVVLNTYHDEADEASRNDLSEISGPDDHFEEYIAAHHFHPKVIDRYFDICPERRPEDDLIPLFITTMTARDRRSCDMSSLNDYDRVVNLTTGELVEDQFWVVPSYSLEGAHEDWRDLMRRRLRGKDISAGVVKRMSQATPPPEREGEVSAILPKWEMAYALAQQMIDHPTPTGRKEKRHSSPRDSHRSAESSLTPNLILTTATETDKWKPDNGSRDDDEDPIPDATDESDSEPSQAKSDLSYSHQVKLKAKPGCGHNTTKEEVEPDALAEPDPKSSYGSPGHSNGESAPASKETETNHSTSGFTTSVSVICTFLALVAIGMVHCAHVLVSRDDALACSTRACTHYSKRSSFSRSARHLIIGSASEVPYYLQTLASWGKSSRDLVCAAAAEAPTVKAVHSWASSTRYYILATPSEKQLLILSFWIQSAQNQFNAAAANLPPVKSLNDWTSLVLIRSASTSERHGNCPPQDGQSSVDEEVRLLYPEEGEAFFGVNPEEAEASGAINGSCGSSLQREKVPQSAWPPLPSVKSSASLEPPPKAASMNHEENAMKGICGTSLQRENEPQPDKSGGPAVRTVVSQTSLEPPPKTAGMNPEENKALGDTKGISGLFLPRENEPQPDYSGGLAVQTVVSHANIEPIV